MIFIEIMLYGFTLWKRAADSVEIESFCVIFWEYYWASNSTILGVASKIRWKSTIKPDNGKIDNEMAIGLFQISKHPNFSDSNDVDSSDFDDWDTIVYIYLNIPIKWKRIGWLLFHLISLSMRARSVSNSGSATPPRPTRGRISPSRSPSPARENNATSGASKPSYKCQQ